VLSSRNSEIVEQQHEDGRRRDLHDWLSPPPVSVKHEKARLQQHAGTGSWFLASPRFNSWKSQPSVAPANLQIQWLCGRPGCGKTVLTSTIIEDVLTHCAADPGRRAAAYHYFDFQDLESRDTRSMLTSIMWQLAQGPQSPAFTVLDKAQASRKPPTTENLVGTLRDMLMACGEAFLILDALDECASASRDELLGMVEMIANWPKKPGWPATSTLRILLTSRKELDIEQHLRRIPLAEEDITDLQANVVANDIQNYIHSKLRTDLAFVRFQADPDLRGEIERRLMDKSDGM